MTLAAVMSAGAACSGNGNKPAASVGTTSTTAHNGVESTSTTAATVVTVPPLQTPVAFGDPAADRAAVPGSIASPAPTMAQLCGGGYVKKSTPPPSATDPSQPA